MLNKNRRGQNLNRPPLKRPRSICLDCDSQKQYNRH
nr:MAG TPA: hypothetical protein [Caudoviricetes sp.]